MICYYSEEKSGASMVIVIKILSSFSPVTVLFLTNKNDLLRFIFFIILC